jgi:hypothetical protein
MVTGNDGGGTVGLIYFEGGELDGRAYETKDLLGKESLNLPILDYKWTAEKRTSEKTQATAQVWKHVSVLDGSTAAPAAAPEPVQDIEPAPVDEDVAFDTDVPEQPVVERVPEDGDQIEEAAEILENAAPASTGAIPPGSELLERRKALKASRADVSERSGLAQSKIDAIENDKPAKRITDDERRKLADTIAQLEAERGGASAHS